MSTRQVATPRSSPGRWPGSRTRSTVCVSTCVSRPSSHIFHFRRRDRWPTPSRGIAGRLRAHGALVAQMLSSILTDAMDQGLIPAQEPEQVIPSSTPPSWVGVRPHGPGAAPAGPTWTSSTPSCCGRWSPSAAHAVPAIPHPHGADPADAVGHPGSVRHSALADSVRRDECRAHRCAWQTSTRESSWTDTWNDLLARASMSSAWIPACCGRAGHPRHRPGLGPARRWGRTLVTIVQAGHAAVGLMVGRRDSSASSSAGTCPDTP